MTISAYSTTAAANTLINGINIAEGCPASGINDAIRSLMADLATQFSGATFPVTGVMTSPRFNPSTAGNGGDGLWRSDSGTLIYQSNGGRITLYATGANVSGTDGYDEGLTITKPGSGAGSAFLYFSVNGDTSSQIWRPNGNAILNYHGYNGHNWYGSNNFGTPIMQLTNGGQLTVGNVGVTSGTAPTNGLYLGGANQPTISVAGSQKQYWNSNTSAFLGTDGTDANMFVIKPGSGSGSAVLYFQRNGSNGLNMGFDGTNGFIGASVGSLVLQATAGSNSVLTLSSGTATFNQVVQAPGFLGTNSGGVGDIAYAVTQSSGSFNYGDTTAGSNLKGSGLSTANTTTGGNGTFSGTWKCKGATTGTSYSTVWQRIA